MKKFPKIIAALLLVSILCGIVAVSVAATTGDDSAPVANQLIPAGAKNVYFFDFDNPDYLSATLYRTTATPATWSYHPNVNGGYSLGFRYDGTSTKCTNANGINVDFPLYTPSTDDAGNVIQGEAGRLSAKDYTYITFDYDIGTDAYAYTDESGNVKTYTLVELAALEAGTAEDKALAAKVKAQGEPAYIGFTQFGFNICGEYFYHKTEKTTSGWSVSTPTRKGTYIYATQVFLSGEVGVYDHFTYVIDLDGAGEDGDKKPVVYSYLNGVLFFAVKLSVADKASLIQPAGGTQCIYRFKSNTGLASDNTNTPDVNEENLVGDGRYLKDSYSMVFDNMTLNYFNAETDDAIDALYKDVSYTGLSAGSSSLKPGEAADLLNADSSAFVWNPSYVYGDGNVYGDRLEISTLASHSSFADNFTFSAGYSQAFGTAPGSTDFVGITQGKYVLNGNETARIYAGKTLGTGDQVFLPLSAKVKLGAVSYYTLDFDFTTDVYYYNGEYYSIEDVNKLEDTALADAIRKDGKAAYLQLDQFGSLTGYAVGTSQYCAVKLTGSNGSYSISSTFMSAGMKNGWLKNGKVPLSEKVGEYNHLSIVFKVNHSDPTQSVMYYLYNGEIIAGAVVSTANLNSQTEALQFQVNPGAQGGSLIIDNVTFKAYPKRYVNAAPNSMDSFFGTEFIKTAKDGYYYCSDNVYNSKYVVADGQSYVSLDNVNKTYIAPLYQEVYDDLEDGGTLYISGVDLLDFIPLNATEFTVVASNGATFTPGGALVIKGEPTTENGITTYVVAEAESVSAVDWYYGDNYLYSESYVVGAPVVFNPAKVDGGIAQYEGFNPATGKITTFGSDVKFVLDADLSDSGIYDAETGTIVGANGYVAFNVELSVEQLNYAMYDAEGNLLGSLSSYKSLNDFKTIYNGNKANVTLIKFYGDGEEVIFVDMVINNSIEIVGKELTVDLNGQKVWFGTKLTDAMWSPMFVVQNGGTLNLINGHIYHVARYGVNWGTPPNNAIGHNIYTPGSLVAVDAGSATLNLGVEGDATKAANFYGTHLIKVTTGAVSANVSVYGGLIQSDNMYGANTTTYAAKAVFDIQGSGTSTIEILDADIIAATNSAVFNVVNGTVNTTVTDSTIITKAINKNNSPTFFTASNPQLYLTKGNGSFTAVNSTLITNAVESNDNFTVTLGKNTRVTWPTQYAKAAEGLVAVLGTVDYSETFVMAKNFETIWASTSGFAKNELFNVADLDKHGYMDLDDVTYTDKITAIIADENDLPAGVTTLTYKDLDGNVIDGEFYAIIGTTPAHPDPAIAGKIVTNNGWYDIVASEWDGEALVTENGVYVAAGRKAVAAFNPSGKVKVGADIMGHLYFNIYVLKDADHTEIQLISVNNSSSDANIGDGKSYMMGTANSGSTILDITHTIKIKYNVIVDSVSTELNVTISFNINKYFTVLVNQIVENEKQAEHEELGFEKTLATYLQYRYYSYLASGKTDCEDAKAIYEGYLASLAKHVADLDAALPELDIDKEVEIDTTDFAGLIVYTDYDIGASQPNAHFWLSKAKVHDLFGATPFVKSSYGVYGYFANEAFNYKIVTPTVDRDVYKEQYGPYQLYILGETKDDVFTPTEFTAPDGTVCYRARIIQGEAANMRATIELSLKVNEETTLVGTYSLLEYVKTVEKTENVDANLKATLKLLYISAVESWNYKVTTVTAE